MSGEVGVLPSSEVVYADSSLVFACGGWLLSGWCCCCVWLGGAVAGWVQLLCGDWLFIVCVLGFGCVVVGWVLLFCGAWFPCCVWSIVVVLFVVCV